MDLSRLTENYEELTDLEKKIIEFLMKNPKEILHLTANELAERMYVSKTSIINLSKKLGFDGYSELRYYFKQHIQNKEKSIQDFSYDDILSSIHDEVSKTLSLQREDNVKSIANRLLKSKVVYIMARGASKPIGNLLSSRLAMLGVRSIFIDDQNLIGALGDSLTPDETLLTISLSGETEIIKNIAKRARAKGIDVIALVAFSNNSLQRIANHKMYCFAHQVETKYNDLISRVGLHALVQILISYINMQRGVML